ncbi:alpha/beta fold hydrolase [Lederbergia galactosidilytica]|uniref:Alpha/beta hydrolase n=2 Tax=Bacillaceae TaxID=186817 RepID=A0A0Q9YJ54_9BACI|nr:alpha/beta hydrolase [Lederbergia galactosidilytica]KRG12174.1 alpha/beta hydrolase [Virgibacillus soli]KRG16775.1 alpha/beta hydrolase [Lederbergia galactosidilytica]OAK74852.1 alpha/beta hydrolase [Lederbergia galactosidilytica]
MLGNLPEIKTVKLKLNDIDVNCYMAGESGSPVILLHGAGVDSAKISWSEVIGFLSKKHRVFAPDLPGYGESDKPNVEYSLSFYIDILKQIMDSLHLEKANLIGLSLGGGISLGFTLEHSARVEKLVLVGAWGLFSKLPYHLLSYWYTKSFLNEISYKWSSKSRRFVKWTLLNSLFGNPNNVSEELVDEIYAFLQEPHAGKAFMSFQRSEITRTGLRTKLAESLSEIKKRTLIVHGSKDATVPIKHAIEAHEAIKDSEMYVMEGCKHWPQKERPEEFTRVITTFLGKE